MRARAHCGLNEREYEREYNNINPSEIQKKFNILINKYMLKSKYELCRFIGKDDNTIAEINFLNSCATDLLM